MELFQNPLCEIIIPPPVQFGDQNISNPSPSSFSSPWPAVENESSEEECGVKTRKVTDNSLYSRSKLFTSQQVKKNQFDDGKLKNIEF